MTQNTNNTHCLIKATFPIDFNRFKDFDFVQQDFTKGSDPAQKKSDSKSDSLLATRKGGSLQLSEGIMGFQSKCTHKHTNDHTGA